MVGRRRRRRRLLKYVGAAATMHSRALFHAAAAIKPLKCPTGREEEKEEEETFLKYVGAVVHVGRRWRR
jgi:hypothetical protein